MRGRFIAVAVAAAAVLAAAAVRTHPAASASEQMLRVGFPAEPANLNPLLAQNEAESTVAHMVFSGLLRESPDGALLPDLATAVPSTANGGIGKDGRTITFRLRHDVRWQDGTPFDASDVVFTYTAVHDPQLDTASAAADLVSVAAPDRWTATFRLRRPHVDEIADYFAAPFVLPRHILKSVTDMNRASFNVHPVGTGPYSFDNWRHGTSIDLMENPYYYGRKPFIPRLRLMFVDTVPGTLMLKTGEIDTTVVEAGGVALLHGSSVGVKAFRRHSLQLVSLNTRRAPLSDPRVRQALNLAVDRSRLMTTVYHGNAVAANELVPPYDWGYTPMTPQDFDLARARTLLDRAGWKAGSDGFRSRDGQPLVVDMIYFSEQQVLRTLAAQLQAAWAEIGVRVQLRAMPVLGYTAKNGPFRTGNYEAVLGSFAFPGPSPDRSILLDPQSPFNDAHYDNADVQRWDDAAEQTYDTAQRRALYALVERRVAHDVPYIPIAWAYTVVGYTDRLARVVVPSAGDVYQFVNDWSFGPGQK